ncbi:Fructose-bisphosphate aldolase class-II [Propionibacterium ruminifibrarum]|uniref:Fructose-bisphosphate aldolase class-II n=1 Tax=Propionibacterium ruminifibrarum TaxID=1962131 RepID=A0A375I253_9ACTN|nr:class II fructose-bisphosphate aldolase [Propionibacterium ruminifibrarum]SPF68153.1 Fructose-bisphosphate aldolase class-II [Propionibacterium ruminifibrarum]
MIIGLPEALSYAEQHNIGLAAINTPFFEGLLGVIDVAERSDVPIILQFAQVHEPIVSIEDMGPAMVELAKRSSAPFVLHVDHGFDIDYIRKGLDIGFNSAMIDGSKLDYDENVRVTREVVELAGERGIGVEGEIGVMTGNENGDPDQGVADAALYTDPQVAADFVKATGVTALAASFGTVHGVYRRKPKLNYELIAQLREATGVPIVMHGGSGLEPREYQECIRHGVRKINYYTYSAKAAYDACLPLIEDPNVILFSNLARAARNAVAEDAQKFVDILKATA